MEIVREIHEGRATVSLMGRLDATWSDRVAEALGECIRAGAHVVRLDLAGVVFLSSAGIRVLLASYRDLSRIGGSLAVVRASDVVFTVLQMSGLTDLLQVQASAPASTDGTSHGYERGGTRFEAWRLADASIRVQAIGDPSAFLSGQQARPASRRLSFPKTGFGIGVAAFGADAADCEGRHGEFLAVAGSAICQAANLDAVPDWMVAEQRLVPDAEMLWGLAGNGDFSTALRFEAAESVAGSISMLDLALEALEGGPQTPLAIAMVAETAQLVGAAVRSPAYSSDRVQSLFEFPAVRDHLVFTAEPAWANAVALVVGVVAREAHHPALAPMLRPLVEDGSVMGHLHAAVFPYRPLRKGRVDLASTLDHLFEDRSVRAVLHLLHDWRQPLGAGQSAFTRGVAWTAPLEVA
jgi:anti-anti-sigma factor